MNRRYCSLYLVRHGETDWNTKGLLQGHTDTKLNQTGISQAMKLAELLKKIDFAAIFSSDLLRAKRTAEIIALEKKIAVKTTEKLRERTFGKYEGKSWKMEKLQNLFKKYYSLTARQRFKKTAYSGYESDENLMIRLIPCLRETAVAYVDKNVLMVTHGGIMRIFLNHLGFNQGRELGPGSITNTAYVVLKSDGVDFFIKDHQGINIG